jgi:hypothetical protein
VQREAQDWRQRPRQPERVVQGPEVRLAGSPRQAKGAQREAGPGTGVQGPTMVLQWYLDKKKRVTVQKELQLG